MNSKIIDNTPVTKPVACTKCHTPEGRGLATCSMGGSHTYDRSNDK